MSVDSTAYWVLCNSDGEWLESFDPQTNTIKMTTDASVRRVFDAFSIHDMHTLHEAFNLIRCLVVVDRFGNRVIRYD